MISLNNASHFVAYLKYATANELMYETETDSETSRTDLWLPGAREGWIRIWGLADANCGTLNG